MKKEWWGEEGKGEGIEKIEGSKSTIQLFSWQYSAQSLSDPSVYYLGFEKARKSIDHSMNQFASNQPLLEIVVWAI